MTVEGDSPEWGSIAASLDGTLVPEWFVKAENGVRMSTVPGQTTISFYRGNLLTQREVEVDGQSAAEWKLTQIAPDQWRWDPVTGP